jgi:predicted sulfurtransferase
MQHDYNESVRKLAEKHEGELQVFDSRAAVQHASLVHRRNFERATLLNRQRKIEQKGEYAADREKIWAMAQVKYAAAISREAMNRRLNSATAPAFRPAKVAPPQVKAEETVTTIELPPLDMTRPPKKPQTARPAC